MSLDPTREEWLAARERVRAAAAPFLHGLDLTFGDLDRFLEAALGPCPPEPRDGVDCPAGTKPRPPT